MLETLQQIVVISTQYGRFDKAAFIFLPGYR